MKIIPLHELKAEKKYLFLSLAFSLTYAYILAGLPIDGFIDRDNYLNYVANSGLIFFGNLSQGLFSFLLNEPIWLFINMVLNFLFDPEFALRIIIFTSSFAFSFYMLRARRGDLFYVFFAIVICLLPQVMKNYVIHLRQGVAIAFVAFMMFSATGLARRIYIVFAPFVHSSYFFLLPNIFISWIVNEKLKLGKNSFSFFLFYFLIACFIVLVFVNVLSFTSARQVETLEQVSGESRSGMAVLFWAVVFYLFVSSGDEFRRNNFFSIASIAIYIMLYFFFDPIARVFESSLPFIFFSGYELKSKRRWVFFSMVFVLFCFQWLIPLMSGGDVFRLL